MTAADWISDRRALIDAATEGPWWQDTDDPGVVWGKQRSDGDGYWSLFASETGHNASAEPQDAALIADARTNLPAALDALKTVLKVHAHSEEYPDECHDGCQWPCPTVTAITAALGIEVQP